MKDNKKDCMKHLLSFLRYNLNPYAIIEKNYNEYEVISKRGKDFFLTTYTFKQIGKKCYVFMINSAIRLSKDRVEEKLKSAEKSNNLLYFGG